MTLKDYSEHFFDDDSAFTKDREIPLAPSTIRQHRQYLRLHILPRFGDTKLQDITFTDLKTFRQSLLQKGLKANTINGIFQTFNQIMKYAFLDNRINKNPLQGFGTLARPKNKDSFRRGEIIDIYHKAPDNMKDFILLLAITGMRLSEAFGVSQADIKKEGEVYFIDLNKQLTEIGYYTPLKTKQKRIIPLPEKALNLIHPWNTTHSTIKTYMRPVIRTISDWEERGLSLHSIRHFFITDTKSAGINPLFVESIAGHSLTGIEAVYTNFHAEDLKSIINWQEEILALTN